MKKICSLGSKQHLTTICSIRILNILEVIAKKQGFSKIEKCSTLVWNQSTWINFVGNRAELFCPTACGVMDTNGYPRTL